MERPVDRHRGHTGDSSGGLESFLGQQQLLLPSLNKSSLFNSSNCNFSNSSVNNN